MNTNTNTNTGNGSAAASSSTSAGGVSSGAGGGDLTASSSAAPLDFGAGHISIDTGAIYRGASQFEGAGTNFEVFAARHQQLESYRPLVNGQSDDSWNQFSPSYQQGTEQFMAGVRGIGQAISDLHQSLTQFAKYCEATEDNATAVAKHALDLNGAPASAGEVTAARPATPADTAGHAGQSQPDISSTRHGNH